MSITTGLNSERLSIISICSQGTHFPPQSGPLVARHLNHWRGHLSSSPHTIFSFNQGRDFKQSNTGGAANLVEVTQCFALGSPVEAINHWEYYRSQATQAKSRLAHKTVTFNS